MTNEQQKVQYKLSQRISSALKILEQIQLLQQMAISSPYENISSYPIDVYAQIIDNPLENISKNLSQCEQLIDKLMLETAN